VLIVPLVAALLLSMFTVSWADGKLSAEVAPLEDVDQSELAKLGEPVDTRYKLLAAANVIPELLPPLPSLVPVKGEPAPLMDMS
jgi:hypothetical protein